MGNAIKQLCNAILQVDENLTHSRLWLAVLDECENLPKTFMFVKDYTIDNNRFDPNAMMKKLREDAEQTATDRGYLCCEVEVRSW